MRPAVLSLLLLTAPAAAQDAQTIPPGGESLLPEGFDIADATVGTWGGAEATSEPVPAEGLPFGRALRVHNKIGVAPRYKTQLSVPTRGDIKKGDTLLVVLWARGEADDGGVLSVHARLQQNGGEYNDGGYGEIVPADISVANGLDDPASWVQYLRPAVAKADQPDGTHSVSIHLGDKAQTVELGGFRVLNYGPDYPRDRLPVTRATYPGAEPDAPWRAAAEARIERLRKGDLTITVKDAAGNPVPGAAVHVELARHAFGFGTAVDADLLAVTKEEHATLVGRFPDQWGGISWDDVLKYREVVGENFNKVVLENDLKIGGWKASTNNDGPRFRRTWTFKALEWCAERDIEVRGHYGVWGPIDAGEPWNTGGIDTGDGYGEAMLEYLDDFVPEIAGKVGEWDAVNHIVGWGPETLGKRYGNRYYADVIARMRELDPTAEMWVNEGNVVSGGGQDPAYRAIIKDLAELGAAPDGVGFMAHFRDGQLTGMEELNAVFDAYADLAPGLKLQYTEIDYDTLNRDLQARYLRDAFILAFAHPAFEGAVQWGFWEGRHWRPDAAFWQDDWSLRPAGQVFRDLVRHRWHTAATVPTAADGTAKVRGFKGTYTITVTAPDGTTAEATATLGETGAAEVVIGG